MKLHPLWNDYPSLKKELNKTMDLMSHSINLANKDVEGAILEMIRSGGKMLRPAYLLLFSQFGKQQELKKTVALASSIEMLHTATLVHDDIVDEATTRRNLATIQHRFGKDVAVYAGDYLFVSCFKLLAKHASNIKSIQLNVDSMEKVLNGELGQMDNRYNLNLTQEQYIQNISGKTAELFSLSCFLGAFENDSSLVLAQQAKTIGLNIGISFQILDDILDYSQNEQTIGKPILEDMRQGVYSLPLLCALTTKQDEIEPLLKKGNQMTLVDTARVYDLVTEAQGVEQAREIATSYTEKALKQIKRLPKNSENTRETLENLTIQLLTRET